MECHFGKGIMRGHIKIFFLIVTKINFLSVGVISYYYLIH